MRASTCVCAGPSAGDRRHHHGAARPPRVAQHARVGLPHPLLGVVLLHGAQQLVASAPPDDEDRLPHSDDGRARAGLMQRPRRHAPRALVHVEDIAGSENCASGSAPPHDEEATSDDARAAVHAALTHAPWERCPLAAHHVEHLSRGKRPAVGVVAPNGEDAPPHHCARARSARRLHGACCTYPHPLLGPQDLNGVEDPPTVASPDRVDAPPHRRHPKAHAWGLHQG
eukprot:CAMPEP_0206218728 /NCGR_PEP_ID=MMETSP0047_2-20121206/3948_1 /ASSEMBLY_ACC=CAM_ASM_000192 /TAXON_ID=195065 /ORGANISM="Chroomonas mesostigmatica_cf, Strain CCMP1168" /LENGTH=226 /DNA_ID=CAMNT_0053641239 /DNA_START=795 /DNA_END=1471 /DNA_ORIENTATION=+